ncbi:hypothetical protein P9112_009960 [Eukaryota sp. TZLM1-RC]
MNYNTSIFDHSSSRFCISHTMLHVIQRVLKYRTSLDLEDDQSDVQSHCDTTHSPSPQLHTSYSPSSHPVHPISYFPSKTATARPSRRYVDLSLVIRRSICRLVSCLTFILRRNDLLHDPIVVVKLWDSVHRNLYICALTSVVNGDGVFVHLIPLKQYTSLVNRYISNYGIETIKLLQYIIHFIFSIFVFFK